MTPIPAEFTAKKFTHRLVKRHGQVAIFERVHLPSVDCKNPTPHFEVVRLAQEPEYVHHAKGNVVVAHERYPGAEEWGTAGFTCGTRETAEKRFLRMV